jgi:hypothetical protein
MMLGTLLTTVLVVAPVQEEALAKAIATVRAAGPHGVGAAEAANAWRTLCQADIRCLPELLTGMDGANPVAKNWFRSAIDAVRDKAQGKTLPKAALEKFLQEKQHDPQARRFVYDLLAEQDKTVPDRFLPGMMDDPSPELRREAVARVFDEAEKLFTKGQKEAAKPLYQKCFQAARDQQQIIRSARKLRDLGEKINLATHLGMVMDWHLIGPFPNKEMQGMDQVYPPEKEVNLDAQYDGQAGKVGWKKFVSTDEMGKVDFDKGIGKKEEAVAYAVTEFTSEKEQGVDIRMASFSAFKLWVNGELILVRGDAYTGTRLDHYVAKAKLKPGKNVILVKFAQDIIPAGLPKAWFFQLRVCDANGVAILSTTRPKTEVAEPKKP